MRYIVTGATGFIGYALCKELLATGNEVVAVIRPNSCKRQKLELYCEQNPNAKDRLQIAELSLDEIGELFRENEITADVFFHLAWNGSSGADREDFDMQYANIKYTADAIRAAKACGCRRFVGAGSQAEYGVVQRRASEQDTVPNPFMMYGAAKVASYEMGNVLAKQLDIEFVWPRIYSVYGVGENPGTLVSYLVDTLLKKESPELSPCDNMWNFIYIEDCVKMLHALGCSERVRGGVYHVASEDTRILKDFVEQIRDVIAPEVELGFGKRTSNPDRTFWLEPDTTKIKSVFGECQWSFEEGIREKMNDISLHNNEKSAGEA